MSKPSWLEAPEWAKALAQDKNGVWNWYSSSPDAVLSKECWDSFSPKPFSGEIFMFASRDIPNKDWIYTLEERP